MKVGVLSSGGKDSSYAGCFASKRDQLSCLITVIPSTDVSYVIRFPESGLDEASGGELGIEGLRMLRWAILSDLVTLALLEVTAFRT